MLLAPIKSQILRGGGLQALLRKNCVANFDASVGVLSASGAASQWSDTVAGHHLLQATGANQPIHLDYSGTKYAYSPGITSNDFSAPDSVASSVTGDIALVADVALADWTPAAFQPLISKRVVNAYQLTITLLDSRAAGTVRLNWWDSGGTLRVAESTAIVPAVDGARLHVAATLDVDNGGGGNTVKFFTSSDGVIWAQLGDAVAQGFVTSIRDTNDVLRFGSDGSTGFTSGKFYSAQIYNGIPPMLSGAGSASPVVDFNPHRDYVSGSTFVSSTTGETHTINSTGSKPAQIVDRPSLLFDGAAHYMKSATFTLGQPGTIYLVEKQVTWSLNDVILDGYNGSNRWLLSQNDTTPKLRFEVATFVGRSSDLAVGATGVTSIVINGAGSSIAVNQNAAVTGDSGAGSANGITLGANFAAGAFANIQVYEALIYATAHDAATRANVIRALMAKWGVA